MAKRISEYIGIRFNAAQILLFGYMLFIIIGAGLLMMPVSSAQNVNLSLENAIFTAISAISGTGLTIVDTATYFSFFGQMVIMMLIQIGNIGYMIFFALAVVLLGGRISLFNKLIIRHSISHTKLRLKQFVIKVFKYTLIVEGAAALLLSVYWMGEMPPDEAVKHGVFNSISSFCNAGFSLFTTNLVEFRNDYFVNLVIVLTAFLGSIGFFVLYDISALFKASLKKARYKLATHSRLVISVTLVIIFFSTVYYFVVENAIAKNHGADTLLEAFFLASSSSTTLGYNTVDISQLEQASLIGVMIEMFIGASPSGTGGGIKTTVFAIMCLSLIAFIRDRKHVNVFNREIHPGIIARAFSISLLALFWLLFSVTLLSLVEGKEFIMILFESTSALGNNGLSMGITPYLTTAGKVILSLSMLIGRMGPLIVGYTLLGHKNELHYKYPEGNILIV